MKYRVIKEQQGFVPQVRRWFRWYDIRKYQPSGISPRYFCNPQLAEQALIQYKVERKQHKKPDIVFMSSD